MECIICKCLSHKRLFVKNGYSYLQCASCGLIYLHPKPSFDVLKKIYSKEYYSSWGIEKGESEEFKKIYKMKGATFESYLKEAFSLAKKGKALDVGCALGFLLTAAQKMGWKPYGVELSEFSAKSANIFFPGKVFNGTLDDAPFENKTFELITMVDLLEHTVSPIKTLARARQLLKNDGVLLIVTPNARSLSAKLMREKWLHYKAEHLYYFSPNNIRILLIGSGFHVTTVKPAKKFLSFHYIMHQLKVYRLPLISYIFNDLLPKLTPNKLKDVSLPIYAGDMLILARKIGE